MESHKVSEDLMSAIDEWKTVVGPYVVSVDLSPSITGETIRKWLGDRGTDAEHNNRLIALIRYVNGEDVFEVEKPKKWVVRSKKIPYDSSYNFVALYDDNASITTELKHAYTANIVDGLYFAFVFDSKEEAEKWSNPLMEVVEVEDL